MANTATSTKRSLPSSSTPPNAKRPRPSNGSTSSRHPDEDEENGDELDDEVVPLDETLLERQARKDARTIRNRESAQRSRNQRKAHLAWLEIRVVELEEENKRLRAGSSTPASQPPPSDTVPTSPLSSLAGDELAFLPTLASGGISLAAVAPPPPGIEVDTKPFLAEQTPPPSAVDQLRAENAALRARLNLLEGLVKQVAAVSNLGAVEPVVVEPLQPESTGAQEPLDWDSIFNATSTDNTFTPSLDLSSPVDLFLAPQPTRLISPTLYSLPNPLPIAPVDTIQQSSPNPPLACHPAAVATPSVQAEWSLQRARTDSGLISDMSAVARRAGLVTEERLDGVARVLVALAKIRGWIPSSSTPLSGMWTPGRAKRSLRARTSGVMRRRGGMRG